MRLPRDLLKIVGALLVLGGVALIVRIPRPAHSGPAAFSTLTSSSALRGWGVALMSLGAASIVAQAIIRE